MGYYWKRIILTVSVFLCCTGLWGCSDILDIVESAVESVYQSQEEGGTKDAAKKEEIEETESSTQETSTQETSTQETIVQETAAQETAAAEVDYVPDWYQWAPTGYDAQDINLVYLQAGKWGSEDGNTVLYVDFASSPDGMDFGLYNNGNIWDDWDSATVDWENLNAEGEPFTAVDEKNGFRFTVPEMGVMDVEKDGTVIRLFLKRSKY